MRSSSVHDFCHWTYCRFSSLRREIFGAAFLDYTSLSVAHFRHHLRLHADTLRTLFANRQDPGVTFAITGPWHRLRA